MPHHILFDHVANHIRLADEEKKLIDSFLQNKRIKKKHFLLQEGDVSRYIAFVLSGILRLYSIDKNGFEHIIQFAPTGWWITDMQSFLTQTKASLCIDAIEDSEAVLLLKSDLDNLYLKIPALERFFRMLAENSLASYQHRLADNLSLTAVERFNNFCRLYPTLTQTLPQKHIASYIGVTPEFFSKILNQPQIK